MMYLSATATCCGREEGAYRYTNGWNLNAVAAAAVGGAVYYALVKARGAPAPRAARAA
jgi:cytosine/uracil/thiamine/allantoin permease